MNLGDLISVSALYVGLLGLIIATLSRSGQALAGFKRILRFLRWFAWALSARTAIDVIEKIINWITAAKDSIAISIGRSSVTISTLLDIALAVITIVLLFEVARNLFRFENGAMKLEAGSGNDQDSQP